MSKPIVNAWNEWDELEEIVVGRADFACFEPTEPGNRPKFRDQRLSDRIPFPIGPKKQGAIDKANEELEGLCALLRAQGAVVRRPRAHDFRHAVQTPAFTSPSQYCGVCPRDVMITFGNEIIEATMSRRARFFEYLPYRELVHEYWESDRDMLWTAAPKPSMGDSMYREEFWEWPLEQRFAKMHSFEFCITQDEVVFDAADCTRLGRDIFVQESMTTNRKGIQ